jgi:hypothetical protein
VRHAGLAVFAAVALIYFTGFWWFTLWLLLAGRVSWRRLFPCACTTGLFWLGMEVVFSPFISGMVILGRQGIRAGRDCLRPHGLSDRHRGVIILGAVVGLVWQERNLSFRAAFSKVRRARSPAAPAPRPSGRAALRALVSIAAVLAVYYWLPLNHTSTGAAITILVIGLVLLIALIAWQVRRISAHSYPRLRAVEALAPPARCSWPYSPAPKSSWPGWLPTASAPR